MGFELKLKLVGSNVLDKTITVQDDSDWTQEPDIIFSKREDYAVFVVAEFHRKECTVEFPVRAGLNPITDYEWKADIIHDGYYEFMSIAFLLIENVEYPSEGDVAYNKTSRELYQWDESNKVWNVVEVSEVKNKAWFKSKVLEVPVLVFSEKYINRVTLEYIRLFREDLINGANQNKLYYKRSNLDYCRALLDGAKYTWSIGSTESFVGMVNELMEIVLTDKTS